MSKQLRLLLALLVGSATTARAASPGSSYSALPADVVVTGRAQALLTTPIELSGDAWVYFASDGRFGPRGAASAEMFIVVDQAVLSSDATIDWRGSASAQQHAFEVIGAMHLNAGSHVITLYGGTLNRAPFYVGAGTNLTVLVRPADQVESSRTGGPMGPFDLHSLGVSPLPHAPLLSARLDPAGAPVVVLAAGGAFQNGHAGDGGLGLYLDGRHQGNGSSLWSVNDLWSGAEVRAPLFTHGYFTGLSGAHTFSLDALELRWAPSQGEDPAVFDVTGLTGLVAMSGGMAVSGSAPASDVQDELGDYVCVASSRQWPDCPPVGTPRLLADRWFDVPTTHNGVVTLLAKSRVQGDAADAGGTVELFMTLDGSPVGSTGVQEERQPNTVSQRTIAASYTAAGAKALAPGPHRVQVWGMAAAGSSFAHLAMVKDLPLVWFDGPDHATALDTSFELPLAGWTTWANCPADGGWYVGQYDTSNDSPAAGGGRYALRLHSTGFTGGGCAWPGIYALSPSVPAFPGTTYAVDHMSRNIDDAGETRLIFYDATGAEIDAAASDWSPDAWQYHASPTVTATAPAGTARMSVRMRLASPNAYADLDLLAVRAISAAEAFFDSFEAGIDRWTVWSNCDAGGAYAVHYPTAADSPAPLGGSYALRLHAGDFVGGGCAWPGMYALGPAIPAFAGATYVVDHMSRNAGYAGRTRLLFYDATGAEIDSTASDWSPDAWQYHAAPAVTATAPAGTTSMRVRYELLSANAYADLDLLHVRSR